MNNPYHFGSPADDLHFTDRQRELVKMRTLMLNGQNLILVAPRRYGKTSLIRQAVRRVRAAGGRTGSTSLIRCTDERDVAEALLRATLEGPLGWLKGRATSVLQQIRSLRLAPQLQIDPASGLVAGLSFSAYAQDTNWHDVIADVVRLLADAGEGKHPVSMVMDEFQKAYEISPQIADLLKDLVDQLPTVSFVFAGSKRYLMDAMANDREHGALYNVGDKLYLEKIPEPDFTAYLVERARAGRKTLSPEVALAIYRAARGIPNDVQLVAFWAFASAGHEMDAASVRLAVRTAAADRAPEFEQIFGGLGLTQQRLLKVIARQPTAHLSATDVQRDLGVSHTNTAKAGQALQRAELIERDQDAWVIANGLLREWLLEDGDRA